MNVHCPRCNRVLRSVGVGYCEDCGIYADEGLDKEPANSLPTASQPGIGKSVNFPLTVILPWGMLVSVNQRKGGMVGKLSKEYRAKLKAMKAEVASQVRGEPTTDPVALEVVYHPPDRRRRDCHNYDKAIMDALTGSVYADDSQVVDWRGRKMPPSKQARAVIEVTPVAMMEAA